MTTMNTLPCDITVERSIIGHILFCRDNAQLDTVGLRSEHFFDPSHRAIWEAISQLDSQGSPFDVVSVASRLNDEKKLQSIGGTVKLSELETTSAAVGSSTLKSYAERLLTLWKARQFISLCQVGQADIRADGILRLDEILHTFEDGISNLITTGAKHDPVLFCEAVEDTIHSLSLNEAENQSVTKTGFNSLDAVIGGGLHPGDLVILAGRPGMGKTAFLLNLLVKITKTYPSAMFSLEMPKVQLAIRVICTEAGLKMSDVRAGNITPKDWSLITRTAERLSGIQLWVDDASSISIQELRAKIRYIQRENRKTKSNKKLRVVGIDYLQLMRGERAQNREQEVSGITRALKSLAKEEDVCIVALSQLNRSTENQSNKRPGLKDLRESGAIEQDADMVMFLYREGYYNEDEDQHSAEIIIAKQRNGATTMVQAYWDPKRMLYTDLERRGEYDEFDDVAEGWTP